MKDKWESPRNCGGRGGNGGLGGGKWIRVGFESGCLAFMTLPGSLSMFLSPYFSSCCSPSSSFAVGVICSQLRQLDWISKAFLFVLRYFLCLFVLKDSNRRPVGMREQFIAGRTRVGWVGTGVMGLAMCERVQAAGYQIMVHARTPSKIAGLCEKGAVSVDSPMAVGELCDVIFTMLSNPSDVREVVLGTKGILAGVAPGSGVVLVDMTSSQPSLAREIYEEARVKGCDSVDAPVSGGDKGAKDGTLAILAGGSAETVAKLEPLFRAMGSVTYMGPPGSGQSCKIANQITVAANLGGLSEGLVFADKAGLDVSKYLSAVSRGAAGSKVMELFGERVIGRDFAPGGFADYMVKDLGMALQGAEEMRVSLPGTALHHQLYLSMKANGDGRLGSHAFITAIERLSNHSLPSPLPST